MPLNAQATPPNLVCPPHKHLEYAGSGLGRGQRAPALHGGHKRGILHHAGDPLLLILPACTCAG